MQIYPNILCHFSLATGNTFVWLMARREREADTHIALYIIIHIYNHI
jgi:hypothetical protein